MRSGFFHGLLGTPATGGGGSEALLLDESGVPTATFGVSAARKLRDAYAGDAMMVRRDNDNLDADIGFSGDDLDETALTDHVGANNGFIQNLYDQADANNASQANDLEQPRIVNSGTIEKVTGGFPGVFFNGTDLWQLDLPVGALSGTSFTISYVIQAANDTDEGTVLAYNDDGKSLVAKVNNNSADRITCDIWTGSTFEGIETSSFTTTDVTHILFKVSENDTLQLFVNGTEITPASSTTTFDEQSNVTRSIGLARGGNDPLHGRIAEMVAWNSKVSDSVANTIWNNVNSYYGIAA